MTRSSRKDHLQEAEVWLAYGKPGMAIGLLESALRHDASREDVRRRLGELRQLFAEQALSGASLFRHRMVAWGCLLLSLAAAFSPVFLLLEWARTSDVAGLDELIARSVADYPFSLMFWVLVAFLVLCVMPVLLSGYIHMYAWFRYLGTLPAPTRRLIEARVGRLYGRQQWEPAHSYLRNKYLGHD